MAKTAARKVDQQFAHCAELLKLAQIETRPAALRALVQAMHLQLELALRFYSEELALRHGLTQVSACDALGLAAWWQESSELNPAAGDLREIAQLARSNNAWLPRLLQSIGECRRTAKEDRIESEFFSVATAQEANANLIGVTQLSGSAALETPEAIAEVVKNFVELVARQRENNVEY